MQPQTRELFRRAVNHVRCDVGPQDEIALDVSFHVYHHNAAADPLRQTLNVFIREIFSKRYTNLSSDIIALLTGLDNVDSIFTEFVVSLDNNIRNGRTGITTPDLALFTTE